METKGFEKASFPGGEDKLYDFIADKKKYHQDAVNAGVEGSVKLQFLVNTSGVIKNIKVLQPLYPSLDKEALRIMHLMPKWIPAQYKGRAVKSKVKLDIDFYFLK
ncbi:MAG TPA: energy transducer TonB [Edaphocola sp.]|nr:energy transducer TonB [Edaphocola sp.]